MQATGFRIEMRLGQCDPRTAQSKRNPRTRASMIRTTYGPQRAHTIIMYESCMVSACVRTLTTSPGLHLDCTVNYVRAFLFWR